MTILRQRTRRRYNWQSWCTMTITPWQETVRGPRAHVPTPASPARDERIFRSRRNTTCTDCICVSLYDSTRVSACHSNCVYKCHLYHPEPLKVSVPHWMFSNFAASYATTTQLVVSLISFILVYGVYRISTFVYDKLTSPIRHIPGPPSPSFIYGNFKQLTESVSRKHHCPVLVIA